MERDELLELINQAAREGWKELDLRNGGITELPPEIERLTTLEILRLGYVESIPGERNELTALPPEIDRLTALQELYLGGNRLMTLPPELFMLTALRYLDLSENKLTTLSTEIGQLINLKSLDFHGNSLTVLPSGIGRLTNLEELNVRHNQLTTLPSEIGQLTALRFLDLSDNDLSVLPPEIGRLTSLQSLDLRDNSLTALPTQIGGLTALTELNCWDNHLVELPAEIGRLTALQSLNLSDADLAALPSEIGQLTALRKLNLSNNELEVLPPEIGRLISLTELTLWDNRLIELPAEIGKLTTLTRLHLAFNRLTALPPEIGQLPSLQELNLNNNDLTTLPSELWTLTALQYLYLSHNRLKTLAPQICQLTALQELNLYYNNLTALPPEIGQLSNLHFLDLRDNSDFPLPFPLPPEILAQVNNAQAIIRAYLDYLAGQRRPLNEIKLVLVGEGSVGKTSIANWLLHDTYVPDFDKTEGIAIHQWKIMRKQGDESEVRINLWDFGGQEIMHATHQFFLTKRTLYILVLDNRLSEAENRLDYWLTLIRSFGGDSPVIIVGNKTDQHGLDLDRRGLLAKYPAVQAILDASCTTGEGIAALREAITAQIAKLPHIADPLLNTWFEVKAKLEQIDADYIPYADYVRICREKGVDNPESQRVLLDFLHDLGVVLHFPDPRLETTNILNPEWVTQGVYRILNTRLPFEEQGILTWDMLARILDDEPYREKRMFVVDMMQKFELCYELPDRKDTFLIPDLLPKEEPDTGAWNGALAFEVHYPVLPGSILTRLIVRMHRHIKERIVWRTGVLLACDGNEALVRADLAANRITIAVRGPGVGRRELLTRIREHLEAIHASLVGLQPAEKVPVPGHPDIPPVDYRWLRDMEREGIDKFPPPGLTRFISVRQLLDGVDPPEARRERDAKYEVHIHGGQVGVIGDEADVHGGMHSA